MRNHYHRRRQRSDGVPAGVLKKIRHQSDAGTLYGLIYMLSMLPGFTAGLFLSSCYRSFTSRSMMLLEIFSSSVYPASRWSTESLLFWVIISLTFVWSCSCAVTSCRNVSFCASAVDAETS